MALVNWRGMSELTRRIFLSHCALAAGGAGLLPALLRAATASQPSIKFPTQARERVAVASYPFREFIAGTEHGSGNPTIELKDFAAHVVEKFRVHRIEPWSAHFPSTDAKYLAEFRAAVEKAHASVANIAVDGEDSPYAADPAVRERAIAFRKHWIDVAVAIGSPSVRTNIPSAKDAKPDVDRLAESLRPTVEYASAKNVMLHLENDNPVSEDPFFIVSVIEKVGSPWLHALPDFANTLASSKDPEHAYAGVDAMFAHAYSICHIKDAETTKDGRLVQVDLPRTFSFMQNHGYQGYFSMEWDRPGDPYAGTENLIKTTFRLLG